MLSIDNVSGMTVLNSGRLELFVYHKYMGKIAEVSGNVMHSAGILPYYWYAKWDDDKPSKIGTLTIPSSVEFYPTDILFDQEATIYPDSDKKEYVVMSFLPKDQCWSSVMVKSANVAMMFTEVLLHAQLDSNIPYSLLSPYWKNIVQINGVKFGLSGPSMDMLVRQVCRYKKDPSILYSQILQKNPSIGQVSYKFMSIVDLCALGGVFSSLSFEYMNDMIDNAINVSRSKKEQPRSPLEDIIYL